MPIDSCSIQETEEKMRKKEKKKKEKKKDEKRGGGTSVCAKFLCQALWRYGTKISIRRGLSMDSL